MLNNFISDLYSLIAMSTLYVLDWHNRTFGYQKNLEIFKPPSSTVKPSIEQSSIGHIIELSDKVWKPPIQLHAPPLTIPCDQMYCHMFCCLKPDEYFASNNKTINDKV